jgi:CheY-like chemotaxis protein
MMPVMDGVAAMRAIRGISPHIPILATSGLSSKVCRPDQPPEEADRFLPKPFEASDLLREVEFLLGAR